MQGGLGWHAGQHDGAVIRGMLEAEMPLLRSQLLAWWQAHGRREPEQKPWMFAAGGRFPDPGEPLPPLGVWIAEAKRR